MNDQGIANTVALWIIFSFVLSFAIREFFPRVRADVRRLIAGVASLIIILAAYLSQR